MRWLGWVVGLALAGSAAAMPPVGTTFPERVFRLQPDTRRCMSPLCGGWWITPVNTSRLVCPDGTRRTACYVASTEWADLGLDPVTSAALVQAAYLGDALVEGVVEIQSVAGYDLPVLRPTRGWWDVTFQP